MTFRIRSKSVGLNVSVRWMTVLLLAVFVIWQSPSVQAQTEERERSTKLAQAAFDSADKVWRQVFETLDTPYQSPTLVIFEEKTVTMGCGTAKSSNPPSYCRYDATIYLDPDFFNLLTEKMGIDSAFALENVVSHEFGHHIQELFGDFLKFQDRMNQAKSTKKKNAVSVERELQADCYSGVWAALADGMDGEIGPDDIAGTLRAALVFGDDALQHAKGQDIDPDAFQHGSGTERAMWFLIGYNSAEHTACATVAHD